SRQRSGPCWTSTRGSSVEALRMADFEKIGVLSDFEEGVLYEKTAGNRRLLIVKHRGRVHALSHVCTHAGFTLAPGKLIRGEIDCPVHGARFALDGHPTRGPADDDLDVFNIRIEGEDVWVEV